MAFGLVLFLSMLALGLLDSIVRRGTGSIVGIVIRNRDNYFLVQSGFSRFLVYEDDSLREIGDIVRIEGNFQPVFVKRFESRFDFGSYLSKKGVRTMIEDSLVTPIWERPWRLRTRQLAFLTRFPVDIAKFIDATLFSRSDYSLSFVQDFSDSGILYFLSASGLTYGAYRRFLKWLLSLRLAEKKAEIILLILLLAPFPFLLSKVGAYRILLTEALRGFSVLRGKQPSSHLSRLSVSGFFLLAFDFRLARDGAFLIGYFLSSMSSLILPLTRRFPLKRRKFQSFLLFSCLLLPLMVEGNAIRPLKIVFSSVLLPLAYPFQLLGSLSFLLFSPNAILSGYASFLLGVSRFFSPFSFEVPLGPVSDVFLMLLEAAVIFLLYLLDAGFTHRFKKGAVFLVGLLALNAMPLMSPLTAQVSFIDVGQGDAILIRKGLTSVLVDTGGSKTFDMAKEVLIPFFRKERIYELDALIVTHGDFDHAGAKESLVSLFPVHEVIESSSSFPYKVGSLSFRNLNPFTWEDENDGSLVLSFSLLGRDWLLMGDATKETERRILLQNPDLAADVLKVGHHGSSSSSSYDFLRQVSPTESVISVGEGNRYGHPEKEVLHRLALVGSSVRRTDLEGTITYRGVSWF